jgi:hypothetical protein
MKIERCFDDYLDSSFEGMRRVSRILVWGQEPHDDGTHPPVVVADVLGMFIAKLGAYEPALVVLIQGFAKHTGRTMRCIA